MRGQLGWVLLLLSACGTAGPGNGAEPRPSEEPRHSDPPPARSEDRHDHVAILSSDGNGRTVTVPVGREFAVRLAENPTTPYRWHILELPEHLRESGSDYRSDAPPGREPNAGEGGVRTLHFAAAEPGSGRLLLVYNREPTDEGGAATFSVTVVTQ